jgi:hypothetical protein
MTAREMRARPPTKTNHFRRLKSGQRPFERGADQEREETAEKAHGKDSFLAHACSPFYPPEKLHGARTRSVGVAPDAPRLSSRPPDLPPQEREGRWHFRAHRVEGHWERSPVEADGLGPSPARVNGWLEAAGA